MNTPTVPILNSEHEPQHATPPIDVIKVSKTIERAAEQIKTEGSTNTATVEATPPIVVRSVSKIVEFKPFNGALRIVPLDIVLYDQSDAMETNLQVMLCFGVHTYKAPIFKKDGRDPTWSEYFNVSNLTNRNTLLQVFRNDQFLQGDTVGETFISLTPVLANEQYSEQWIDIKNRGKITGKIHLAFKPRPLMTEDQIIEENCKLWASKEVTGAAGQEKVAIPPSVKAVRISLLEAFISEGSKHKMKPYVIIKCGDKVYKSHVDKKGDHYPSWNEYFNIQPITATAMTIQLYDKEHFSKGNLIGECSYCFEKDLPRRDSIEHWIDIQRESLNVGRVLISILPLTQGYERELKEDQLRTQVKRGKIIGIHNSIYYEWSTIYDGVLRVVPIKATFNNSNGEEQVDAYVVLRCGSYKYKSHVVKDAGALAIWSDYFNLRKVQSKAIDIKVYEKGSFGHKDLLGQGVFEISSVFAKTDYSEQWVDLFRDDVKVGQIFLGFEPRPRMTDLEVKEENKKKSLYERVKDKLSIHKEGGIPLEVEKTVPQTMLRSLMIPETAENVSVD